MSFMLTMSSLEDRLADVQRSAKRRKLQAKEKEDSKNKKADQADVQRKMYMYALFSKGAYMRKSDNRQKILDDYKIGYTLDQRNSTKDIAIYKKNDGGLPDDPDVVMAFRGTKYFRDVLADTKITMSEIEKSGRFKKSFKLFQEVFNQSVDDGKTMLLTGHSLGGSLAAAIGRLETTPSITFNPGSGASVFTKDQHMGNSVQYTTNGSDQADPISWLSSVSSRPGEEVVTVGENKLKSIFPKFSLDAHSLSNFLPAGVSKSYWEDLDKEDATGYTWKETFDEALETLSEYAEDEVDNVKAIPGELTGGEGSKPFYENVLTDVSVGGGILSAVAALVKRKQISEGAASLIRGMVTFATMPAGGTARGVTGFLKGVFTSPKRMFNFLKNWHESPWSTREQLSEYIHDKLDFIKQKFTIKGDPAAGYSVESLDLDDPVFTIGDDDEYAFLDELHDFDEQYNIDSDVDFDEMDSKHTETDDTPADTATNDADTQEIDFDPDGPEVDVDVGIKQPLQTNDTEIDDQEAQRLIDKYTDQDVVPREEKSLLDEPVAGEDTPLLGERAPDVGVGIEEGAQAMKGVESVAQGLLGEVAGDVAEALGPEAAVAGLALPVYFDYESNKKRDHINQRLTMHHNDRSGFIDSQAQEAGYNPEQDIKSFIHFHPETATVLMRPDGSYDYDAFYGPYGALEFLEWRNKNKKKMFGKGLDIKTSLEQIRKTMNPYSSTYVNDILTRRKDQLDMQAPEHKGTGDYVLDVVRTIPGAGGVERKSRDDVTTSDRMSTVFGGSVYVDDEDLRKKKEKKRNKYRDYVHDRMPQLQRIFQKSMDKGMSNSEKWQRKAPTGDDKTFRYSSSTKTYVHIDETGAMSHKIKLSSGDKQILTSWRGKGAILHDVEELNDEEFDYLIKTKKEYTAGLASAAQNALAGQAKADREHPAVKKQFGGSVTGAPHTKAPSRSVEKNTHGGGHPEIDRNDLGAYNRNEFGGPLSNTNDRHTNETATTKADKRDLDSNAATQSHQTANHGNGTGIPHGNDMVGLPPLLGYKPHEKPSEPSNPDLWKTSSMRTNGGIGGATQPLGGVPVDHVHTATGHPQSTPAHQVTPGDSFDPFQSTLGSEETFSSSNNQGISLRQIHLRSHLDNKWNQTALTAASDVNFMRVMNAREGNW